MTYFISIMIYLMALIAVGIYKIGSIKNSEDFMVAEELFHGTYSLVLY